MSFIFAYFVFTVKVRFDLLTSSTTVSTQYSNMLLVFYSYRIFIIHYKIDPLLLVGFLKYR